MSGEATGAASRIDASAIAFDLDGTLLDTVHELATAVNALLAELGHPALAKDVVGTMIGKGMANLVRRALGGYGAAASTSIESGVFAGSQNTLISRIACESTAPSSFKPIASPRR